MAIEGLTDEEIQILEATSIEYPSGVDISTVNDIVENLGGEDDFLLKSYSDSTPEERAAIQVFLQRHYKEEYKLSDQILHLLILKESIKSGAKILERNDDYYRFQPCIELIFELDSDQLETLFQYISNFEESDFTISLEQNRQKLFDQLRNCTFEDIDAQAANELIKVYQDSLPIFERGFPNLLAFKRILDGDNSSNTFLQKKSASSVRRELTDSSKEPNSIYFDLIVDKFDKNIRNGIAHGDIINDGERREIRIPTQNTRYSYEELAKIVEENLSNATFLTGMYRAIIEWRYRTYEIEGIGRENLGI